MVKVRSSSNAGGIVDQGKLSDPLIISGHNGWLGAVVAFYSRELLGM